MFHIQDWLANQAQTRPEHPALIFGAEQWSYAQLNQSVAHIASQLHQLGVTSGQQVAVLMTNQPDFVQLIHAVARLGAVLVPLNVRLTGEELAFQLRQADCRYLIYHAPTAPQQATVPSGNWTTVNIEDLPATNWAASQTWLARSLELDRLQSIVHTSGTTGRPKGTMLSFANHFWSATASAWRLGHEPDDRWLLCLPLFHVGGMAIVLRASLYGITIVLHERFQVEAVNQALDTERISLVSLVPTMLQWLLTARHYRPYPTSLRTVLLGGAAASPQLVGECHRLNIPLATTYGLTETASQIATATPAQVTRKPGCVGKPLSFSQITIVDEHGQAVPTHQIGQIMVTGPTVMLGYYHNPEATELVLSDGDLLTGDLGYVDEDGDLWIVQRRTDLIVTGGENVYPSEVERVLEQHPAVNYACVVGLPDAEWGHKVTAAVELHPGQAVTPEELQQFCQHSLARYKTPRFIGILRRLPMTSSGKIQRASVERWLTENAAG